MVLETKQVLNFNTSIHRKTCLSECLTEATLAQARLNLLSQYCVKKKKL